MNTTLRRLWSWLNRTHETRIRLDGKDLGGVSRLHGAIQIKLFTMPPHLIGWNFVVDTTNQA